MDQYTCCSIHLQKNTHMCQDCLAAQLAGATFLRGASRAPPCSFGRRAHGTVRMHCSHHGAVTAQASEHAAATFLRVARRASRRQLSPNMNVYIYSGETGVTVVAENQDSSLHFNVQVGAEAGGGDGGCCGMSGGGDGGDGGVGVGASAASYGGGKDNGGGVGGGGWSLVADTKRRLNAGGC